MLKENKSLKSEIVSFKLGSGEEIIAKVKEHNDDTFELNKAVVLAMAPDGGMRLIPWLMSTNNDDILLNKTREEYVTRKEMRDDLGQVMDALHRLEDKLDKVLSKD